jgi:predicted DNA-binding protein
VVQLFEENSCNSIKCREKKMARPKKNGTYLNVCIETPIYERLENFCKDAGHTKTVAVERALISYFDEYEEMKKKLKELESNQDK